MHGWREHLHYLDANLRLILVSPKLTNSKREEVLISVCILLEELALKELIAVSTIECLRLKMLNWLKKIIYVMCLGEQGMRHTKTTIKESGLSIRSAELSL